LYPFSPHLRVLCLRTHFNIILPSSHRYHKLILTFKFPDLRNTVKLDQSGMARDRIHFPHWQVPALHKINNTDSSGRDYRICSHWASFRLIHVPPWTRFAVYPFASSTRSAHTAHLIFLCLMIMIMIMIMINNLSGNNTNDEIPH
jgi:hypothetical protein